jgi:hypothetical protein
MSLRPRNKYNLPPVISNFNTTAPSNPSHAVDDTTDFVLRTISLENLDEAVFKTFDKRFTIAGKQLNLIELDSEVASQRFENPEQFNKIKQYLNLPYFTMWRPDAGTQFFRTSPSFKPIIYCIPKMKPQGLVYTEWITTAPIFYKFPYNLLFLTTYRENANTFEQYMMQYFKNKRAIICLENERFEIQPVNPKKLADMETTDRDGKSGQSIYKLSYNLELVAYTRKAEDIQKRERVNRYIVNIEGVTGNKNAPEVIETVETRNLTDVPDNTDQMT